MAFTRARLRSQVIWTSTHINGGEGGIRTHGTLARSPVFKTGTFNHSVTSPDGISMRYSPAECKPVLNHC